MGNSIQIDSDFEEYINIFLEENSKLNLISRNDEKFLYEKHIYDSLAIKLFFDKYGNNFQSILDIGCGGGFPCVPIAIEYPDIEITGIDSIQKKIASIERIKAKLNLRNLNLICDRAENIKNLKYDLILSRAVADLAKITAYAAPLLKKNGYFLAYKSKKADVEIAEAENNIKKFGMKIIDTIEYTLPTEDTYLRKLICLQKL